MSAAQSRTPMTVTVIAPSVPQPVGGNIVFYELANGMRRRGHRVHLVHVGQLSSLGELPWFRFEDGIEHRFLPSGPLDIGGFPQADFVLNPGSASDSPSIGLPLNVIQGYGALQPEVHLARMTAPWPKVCVARWILDVGRELGVPEQQLVYVPPGIDHDKYRIVTPLEQRTMQVAALYNSHPVKGATFAIDAIAEAQRRIPELHSVLFGIHDMEHALPPGTVYLQNPPQAALVDRAYNQSRVFVCASTQEGFGLCSIEAMACGSALVTSSTRGSDDFAFHEHTALVSQPTDVATMADNIESLLRDDTKRIALAQRGASSVAKFDWDESARILEDFLERYGNDPNHYRCHAEA